MAKCDAFITQVTLVIYRFILFEGFTRCYSALLQAYVIQGQMLF